MLMHSFSYSPAIQLAWYNHNHPFIAEEVESSQNYVYDQPKIQKYIWYIEEGPEHWSLFMACISVSILLSLSPTQRSGLASSCMHVFLYVTLPVELTSKSNVTYIIIFGLNPEKNYSLSYHTISHDLSIFFLMSRCYLSPNC